MTKETPTSEVEDVLSSIRKLVSEDAPGREGEGAREEAKLLLTPQLRIGEEEGQADAGDVQDAPMLLDNPLILPDGDLDAAAQAPSDAPDAPGDGEVATVPGPGQDIRDPASVDPNVGAPDASLDSAAPQDEGDVISPPAVAGLDDAMVERDGQDRAGQGAELSLRDSASDSEAAMTAAALHALHGRESHEDREAGRASHALEDKLGELEAMISQVADHQDADVRSAEGDTDAGPSPDRTTAGLDETALRALVAEVVREELEGALGERVTRNIRKLVRREIQRALAERDLG